MSCILFYSILQNIDEKHKRYFDNKLYSTLRTRRGWVSKARALITLTNLLAAIRVNYFVVSQSRVNYGIFCPGRTGTVDTQVPGAAANTEFIITVILQFAKLFVL